MDALPELVHPATGRVHASFNQDVAATGRLSSSDPNLQNIPVRTATGREIRSAFLPGRGRAGGCWPPTTRRSSCGCWPISPGIAALMEAFAADEDIHARVASEVHGVPLEEVTLEMRRQAKAVNFGVIYGQSPFGLAKSLGIDQAEAATFIDAYFDRYPGVEEFFKTILVECHQNGYVSTILGRRRAGPGCA